jgi:proteasome accessory factor B
MSSRKTERQLDLLFILLNSSRPMTRETIRQKIDEYREQTNPEAFERMFERDKDDLRNIGVPIETKLLNQLFEDEYGYSIDIKDFGYKETGFTVNELSELTRAALVWQDSVLASNARLGLVKTATSGGNSLDVKQDFEIQEIISDHMYLRITEAVTHGKIVEMLYVKPSDKIPSSKTIFPYELNMRGNFIYLLALDMKDAKIKSFNLSRIIGEVLVRDASAEELNEFKQAKKEESVPAETKIAVIKPLVEPVVIKHLLGGEERDGLIHIDYFHDESFAIFLAPYSYLIESIEPLSLKRLVIEQLEILKEKLT